jgi:glycosyltransferase involved in cell wall biosynthesis
MTDGRIGSAGPPSQAPTEVRPDRADEPWATPVVSAAPRTSHGRRLSGTNMARKLRIAEFLVGRPRPDSANGVENTVYYLSGALAKEHDVRIFAVSRKGAIDVPGVEVSNYAPGWHGFVLPRALRHDLLAWRPDVVHIHSVFTPTNVTLGRWLRFHRVPYVVRPAGGLAPDLEKKRPILRGLFKHLFELPLLSNAMFVHSVGDSENIRRFGVKNAIETTSKGVDLSVRPRLQKRWLEDRHPGLEEQGVLLFVGRVEPRQKGLDLLVRAMAEIANPNVKLVLVGPDSPPGGVEGLTTIARSRGIEGRVIFAGPAYGQALEDYLAGADVFVHTSRWEGGLPYAVLEAAAMGKPCLVTPAVDREGLIRLYAAGIVVEPDVASIAGAIDAAFALSADEREKLGRAARKLVEDRYDWDETAASVASLFRRYLPQGPEVASARQRKRPAATRDP